jgi:hypothetical protein
MRFTLRSVLVAVAAAVTLAGSVFACTLLVPANGVQCSTSDDCQARGPQFAGSVCVANICLSGDAGADDTGPWGCLNTTPEPSDPNQQVDVQIVFYDAFQPYTLGGSTDGGTDLDLVNYAPQTGVTVLACDALDPDCQSPVAPPATSDDAGVASLVVPGGFTGFYRLDLDGYVPTYLYAGARLLAGQPKVSFPAAMTSEAEYSALQAAFSTSVNADQDAGPGVVTVTQFDCLDKHAPGVAFTSSPAPAQTLYLASGGIPSPGTMQTQAGEGAGVLLNVPSGGANITATLLGAPDAGPAQVVSTANVVVHPGTFTVVYLRPRTR